MPQKRQLSPDTEPKPPLEELEITAKTAGEIKRKIQTEKNVVEKDLARYTAAIVAMIAVEKSSKTQRYLRTYTILDPLSSDHYMMHSST